jgi:UDP-N-acetylmuramoyl-tripeptide--D-alanyl-D-alanine ligase
MIPLSAREIAALVGGRLIDLDPGMVISSKVEFDSRKVEPGDLFLAVKGDRVDGHDYAAAAIERGAVAVIATRPVGTAAIVVAEPIAALTALATAVAGRLAARIVEVTGSSGKTSTKDLIAQVLAQDGTTVAPPESFNNELGFPYTVLLAGHDTRYLVLEASSRGIGHIRQLTEIARPAVAAVLNVGSAHLGEFGSAAAIAQAKGELVEALPADGVAVLNADDPLVLAMAGRTAARTLTFGVSVDADIRAERVRLDRAGRAGFDLVTGSAGAPVSLQVRGEHQVGNALAAAGVALSCGMAMATVAEALSQATPRSRWRMEVTDHPSGVSVINDAYNANPESMASALRALAVLAQGRRAVAVLGEMAELGPHARQAHEAAGALAAELGVQHLIAVGGPARPIVDGAGRQSGWHGATDWVEDNDAAIARLRELLRPGDVLLVKGSRSAQLQLVASGVLDWLAAGAGTTGP